MNQTKYKELGFHINSFSFRWLILKGFGWLIDNEVNLIIYPYKQNGT